MWAEEGVQVKLICAEPFQDKDDYFVKIKMDKCTIDL